MSDRSFKTRKKKLRAVCLFLRWLRNQLQGPREHLFQNDDAAFLREMDHCLVRTMLRQGSLAALANWGLLSRTRRQVFGRSPYFLVVRLAVPGLTDSIRRLWKAARALLRKDAAGSHS